MATFTSQFIDLLEKYLEHHCIDRKWIAYLERRGKTFDPHKIEVTDLKNVIGQFECSKGRTPQTDKYIANFVESLQSDSGLFSTRLGAKPLPITDAERAKMLETHRGYFANMLFDFMKRKNLSETDVAAKARLDVNVFSRLRNDRKYQPTEQTVWALIFALELNLADANTLMDRAKVYLSFNVWSEVIIGFFLDNRVYDLDLLNEALTYYGLEPLEVTEDFSPPPDEKFFHDNDLIARIDLYIEENFQDMSWVEEQHRRGVRFSIRATPLGEPTESEKTFEAIINQLNHKLGLTGTFFSYYLFTLIKQKNLTDVEVYKSAHLDRRIFSKLRNEKTYMPSKKTVVAIAFALKLDFKETNKLLARAGYFLSSARKEDVIAAYFFDNQIYNLSLINEVLDYYNCPILGD